ncbi:hypothetical protein [Lacimonas salitolerans]|uniref:Transcriptional regulator n=1 Tax=Lacimonas salitolerans TaxID=1323750 RepID=A0ABW4EL49_9RHOB
MKKKATTDGSKSAKRQSDYKSRESEGKVNKTDAAFDKAFGKGKVSPRKG